MAATAAKDQALRLARVAADRYAGMTEAAAQFLDVVSRLPALASASRRDCSLLLADLLARHPVYRNIAVAGPDGSVLCRARVDDVALDKVSHQELISALGSSDFAATSYRVDRQSGDAHAVYARRISDTGARPKFVYVVADANWLKGLAYDAALPEQSALTLFDARGTLLAAVPATKESLGRHAAPPPILAAMAAQRIEGTAEGADLDGKHRFYAYVSLGAKANQLYLAVGLPDSYAYAPVAELQRKTLIGAILMGLALLIVVNIVADLLVLRHIRTLLATARRLGAGELSARTGIPRHRGEIHQLAQTFDEMASALQARETESRIAQEALSQSEARFRRLADNAPDVIYRFRLGANYGYEYISPATTRFFGYTPGEFYGDRDLGRKIIHPDDRRTLANIMRGRTPATVEMRWIRKDGTIVWTEQRNVPVFDANGKRIAIEGIARDITARKQAEQELRLLQTIALAVSEAEDMEAGLSIVLRAVCEATGWTMGQAWVPSEDGRTLLCSPAWYARAPGLEEFRAVSEAGVVERAGMGAQAVVARERRPLWIRNIAEREDFGRRAAAVKAGLRAVIMVPVAAGNDLEALIEFFMREPRPEDEALVQTVNSVAAQLGALIRRKRTEARLVYLAHHDVLTGLPNRALFSDRLRQALFEANRQGRLVAVAFLDLDRFKNINDSLGHETGDLLLRGVADQLLQSVRETDTVARISGDEFMLVLPGLTQVDDAARIAQKILTSLRKPFVIAGQELFVSASLGIAIYPHDAKDVEGLLRNADVAMYRAKDMGRNAYQFYAAEMTAHAQERLNLESALRRALERGDFVLHYQPIVDSASGLVVGAEALMRWRHAERGVIDPAQFIPLAEETGLIVPMGEWVLRTACAQCVEWEREGLGTLRIAVNISPRQFQRPDLADTVASVLRDTGLPPERLELELTEGVLLRNPDETIAVMGRLNAMGVQLCIDDFGTGYSSLSYLKRFPINQLKIDQSFVQGIPGDEDDAAIATAIIAMAHNLKLRVIAEGVETMDQLDYLRQHRCDEIQGNYFSKSLANLELAQLLQRRSCLPPAAKPSRSARIRNKGEPEFR